MVRVSALDSGDLARDRVTEFGELTDRGLDVVAVATGGIGGRGRSTPKTTTTTQTAIMGGCYSGVVRRTKATS